MLKDRDINFVINSYIHKFLAFHSERIVTCAGAMAGLACKKGYISRSMVKHIKTAAFLHDIGKLVIPERILNKPDKLNEEEWVIVKKHPAYGHELLKGVSGISSDVKHLVKYHHERRDGRGYYGITDIGFSLSIILVSDKVDAMRKKRSYSSEKSIEEAVEILEYENMSGAVFDNTALDIFKEIYTNTRFC